jgi:hypothetical protein
VQLSPGRDSRRLLAHQGAHRFLHRRKQCAI